MATLLQEDIKSEQLKIKAQHDLQLKRESYLKSRNKSAHQRGMKEEMARQRDQNSNMKRKRGRPSKLDNMKYEEYARHQPSN